MHIILGFLGFLGSLVVCYCSVYGDQCTSEALGTITPTGQQCP